MHSSSPSPSPDFLTAFGTSLVAPAPLKPPGTTTIDFDGLLSPPLTLHEDLTDGCGGQLWPAGMVLARYLLRNGDLVRGKTVVEIGAGGGLVGLAISLSSTTRPATTILTDLPILLPLLQKNIHLNNLPPDLITALPYAWGSSPLPSPLLPQARHPDVLLAADCVYLERSFAALLQTLHDLIGPETLCLFCFKKRRRADLGFIKKMRRAFVVEEVDGEGERGDGIFLYRVTKKP